jgi:antitoxin HigA-1
MAFIMKNPSHPGRIVVADFEELGLSIAEAAGALGVSRQQLNRVVNGTSAISPDMALRLEAVIGGSAEHLLRMQVQYDLAQAKREHPVKGLKRIVRRAA